MVLDRINFIDNFLNEIDSDRKMKVIRDHFVNVMLCYNIGVSYNATDIKIVEHSEDYNVIILEISTDKEVLSNIVNTLKSLYEQGSGLLFEIYQEKFCATFVQENEDDMSILVKISKIVG